MNPGLWRSVLFVPGTRPDRFEKAFGFGADIVCIDLEDAVGPGEKESARAAVAEFVNSNADLPAVLSVRINHPRSDWGRPDLEALARQSMFPEVLMAPKIESPDDIQLIDAVFTERNARVPIFVIVESALGLQRVDDVLNASPSVIAAGFGAVDFSADVGCANSRQALAYGRGRMAAAAAAANLPCFDGPTLDIDDTEQLLGNAAYAKEMGFSGVIAIHPKQVGPIHEVFMPSEQEVAFARKVIEAERQAEGGVIAVDGRMIDVPVVINARRTLAMAERQAD